MASAAFEDWRARGESIRVGEHDVFAIDVPATGPVSGDPILVLHGFPTSSYDWVHVLPILRSQRRVVLFDFIGFGLSSKPDERYSVRGYADTAEAVAKAFGLRRVALVTHDVGDTVGGELLARDLEGRLPFAVTSRVLTNGSIYLDLAQLTAGQQMLLAAPDERLDLATLGLDPASTFKSAIAQTCASPPSDDDLDAQWEFASYEHGDQLLTRTIRYIEDRRAEESRFTGAVEHHASPLGVVWGALDPIAVLPMTERLLAARPDTRLITLPDVAHYPMVEAPDRFAAAVLSLL
jgi:pimeloyl-ACP methyl ester carboxylesterase